MGNRMKAALIVLVLSSVLVFGLSGCTGVPGSPGETTPDASSGSAARAVSSTGTVADDVGTTATTLKAAGDESPVGTTATGPTPPTTIGEPGERRNPIPMNQEAQVGDWKVAVVGADLDATQIVLEENMFNAAPGEGNRYVLLSLEATYLGAGSSTFWLDMLCSFVGNKGDSFDQAAVVSPDSMMDEGEVLPGTRIAGNLVFEVASDQVLGGTLLLQEAFSFEKSRMFFAVQ